MHWFTTMAPLMLLLLVTQHVHGAMKWQQSDNGNIDEDLIELEDNSVHSLGFNSTKNEEELNNVVFMLKSGGGKKEGKKVTQKDNWEANRQQLIDWQEEAISKKDEAKSLYDNEVKKETEKSTYTYETTPSAATSATTSAITSAATSNDETKVIRNTISCRVYEVPNGKKVLKIFEMLQHYVDIVDETGERTIEEIVKGKVINKKKEKTRHIALKILMTLGNYPFQFVLMPAEPPRQMFVSFARKFDKDVSHSYERIIKIFDHNPAIIADIILKAINSATGKENSLWTNMEKPAIEAAMEIMVLTQIVEAAPPKLSDVKNYFTKKAKIDKVVQDILDNKKIISDNNNKATREINDQYVIIGKLIENLMGKIKPYDEILQSQSGQIQKTYKELKQLFQDIKKLEQQTKVKGKDKKAKNIYIEAAKLTQPSLMEAVFRKLQEIDKDLIREPEDMVKAIALYKETAVIFKIAKEKADAKIEETQKMIPEEKGKKLSNEKLKEPEENDSDQDTLSRMINTNKNQVSVLNKIVEMAEISNGEEMNPKTDIPGRLGGADKWARRIFTRIAAMKITFGKAFNPETGRFILARVGGVGVIKHIIYDDQNLELLKDF